MNEVTEVTKTLTFQIGSCVDKILRDKKPYFQAVKMQVFNTMKHKL